MNDYKRISQEALTGFASDAVEALGAPAAAARTTAEVLVAADLRGISSHGVAGGTGLRELVERIRAGAIDPAASPEVRRKEGWASAAMDAKGGIGQPAAMDAARLAGDLAEKFGCGKVHVYNANHFGAACVYVEALIELGFAARATCTAGAWMKPYGGKRVRQGTNPIAWGVPCGKEAVVIDIATTQRAVSPAVRAVRAGEPIPPDYFLDKDGNPMSGAVSYQDLFDGTVLPLGGEQFGYKGSGLNILIDLDNVIGGGSTARVKTMREEPRSRIAQTFEAWRIDVLFSEEEALRRLAHAVQDIRNHGGDKMLLPGEREARKKSDGEANGIPYEESQWETLRSLSEATGVAVPDPAAG